MTSGMTDADLAAHLAEAAGRLLLAVQGSGVFAGEALGKEGDRIANDFLVDALAAARPDDGLLSEERACDGARLAMRRVWIVDPVDGTREYGEGRADWAVHVGLAIDGVAAVGAVALPANDRVLRSDRPAPVLPPHHPLRIAVSRSRPAPVVTAAIARLDAAAVPMGSAGAKAMAVVTGEVDAYLHAGGQREWDSCAPVAVAAAHGLHCSRLDGAPLLYNQVDVSIPDLVICHREDAAAILTALAA